MRSETCHQWFTIGESARRVLPRICPQKSNDRLVSAPPPTSRRGQASVSPRSGTQLWPQRWPGKPTLASPSVGRCAPRFECPRLWLPIRIGMPNFVGREETKMQNTTQKTTVIRLTDFCGGRSPRWKLTARRWTSSRPARRGCSWNSAAARTSNGSRGSGKRWCVWGAGFRKRGRAPGARSRGWSRGAPGAGRKRRPSRRWRRGGGECGLKLYRDEHWKARCDGPLGDRVRGVAGAGAASSTEHAQALAALRRRR